MKKLLFVLLVISTTLHAGTDPVQADNFFVFVAQSAKKPGLELFDFLSAARTNRLGKMMETSRGRWNFDGSPKLSAELKDALQRELVHGKFPWKALTADCRQEIREQYPGESDDRLAWIFKLCDAENVKKAQGDLQLEVDSFQSQVESRDRYILVMNRVSQEIYGQLPVIKNLNAMVANVGDCTPTNEDRITACLIADARFRDGMATLLADTQMMIDAVLSVPGLNKIPSGKQLFQMLEIHRREYIRILKEQATHKIQGIIPK